MTQFPQSQTIGLVWDACPSHLDSRVSARIEELKQSRRLITAVIPGGLTSILQLGDLVVNAPCKRFLRRKYSEYTMSEIERRRNVGENGRIVITITREMLMTWCENFVTSFNYGERTGSTNILLPCLTKIGQNCFEPVTDNFDTWLTSLSKNALYKSMLEAHMATSL